MYRRLIMEATGCSREEVEELEDIMRHDIFRSTLDWQTEAQLQSAARQAYRILHAN